MKPYNPDAKCPKCGYARISAVYMTEGTWATPFLRRQRAALARTCQRCHHWWDEAPLDAPDEEGERK